MILDMNGFRLLSTMNDEFRDVVLEENVIEVTALVINVLDVGGMRLECPVRVTSTGGEMLYKTP